MGTSLVGALTRRPHDMLRAVDGVDMVIARGETLGLVGESGCGKSTLGRCIVGLYQPTAGEVLFAGEPMAAKRERAQRRRIQMVFQDPYSSLNPRLTVRQALSELLRAHNMVPSGQVEARCRELMELVGLAPGALEAPVSALDVSVQATVLNLLEALQQQLGLTMLFIAHNMAVVRHVCDRVSVMYLGKIVETAPTAELFTNPRHPYTQGLMKAVPRLVPGRTSEAVAVAGDPGSPISPPSGCRFHPRCPIAQDVCSEREPNLDGTPEDAAHLAACHFAWTATPPRHEPEVEQVAGGVGLVSSSVLGRLIETMVVNAAAIWVAAAIFDGITYSSLTNLLLTGLVLGVVNFFVRPVVNLLTLPITIVTLGLWLIVVNAFMLLLTSWLVSGFAVDGFLTALGAAVVIGLVNWALSGIMRRDSSSRRPVSR